VQAACKQSHGCGSQSNYHWSFAPVVCCSMLHCTQHACRPQSHRPKQLQSRSIAYSIVYPADPHPEQLHWTVSEEQHNPAHLLWCQTLPLLPHLCWPCSISARVTAWCPGAGCRHTQSGCCSKPMHKHSLWLLRRALQRHPGELACICWLPLRPEPAGLAWQGTAPASCMARVHLLLAPMACLSWKALEREFHSTSKQD
jgi:hypothetical protein